MIHVDNLTMHLSPFHFLRKPEVEILYREFHIWPAVSLNTRACDFWFHVFLLAQAKIPRLSLENTVSSGSVGGGKKGAIRKGGPLTSTLLTEITLIPIIL